jgi:sortase A
MTALAAHFRGGVRIASQGMRILLAALVLALGLAGLALATWADARTYILHALIARAWERERSGEPNARPWPWADTHPVALLSALAGAEELVVLEGSRQRNLLLGPAHDPASVLPGERGNAVIEGARDTQFRFLRALRIGDRLRVDLADGRTVCFEVSDWRVVDLRHWHVTLGAATPRLTLITHYPFDTLTPGGPLRFVVTADWIAGAGNVPSATAARAAGPPARLSGG